ncbi:MAG: ribosome hibernation-promoting factor, HPF/YfiA family [Oceanicaulis sp.]
MQIQFVSKGIDVSPALRERIDQRITDAASKYFNRPAEAFVTASKEGHGFKVDISVHLPSGAFLQASGQGGDAYGAVEDASTHLEKRLRRYKRKLKDHHADNKPDLPAEMGSIITLRSERRDDLDAEEDDDGGAQGGDEPVIIAEQVAELRTLTVSMAVLEMNLADAPFLMFRNASSGAMNVVYRRPDGHVGWIDPSRGAKGSAGAAAE